jgi:orotidine-5'-phosphate decarboxylase
MDMDEGSRRFLEEARARLVFALDVDSRQRAKELVGELSDEVGLFKIGLELFTAEGPDIVREVIEGGGRVFLDLKLHDIPATVRRAAAAAARLGVDMLTVHAGEGPSIPAAGVEGAGQGGGGVKVLGVTVLTSLEQKDLDRMGIKCAIDELVSMRAEAAVEGGCAGLVCSPKEVRKLRELVAPSVELVVPGVRPEWAKVRGDDQARKATPAETVARGADYLVVGRPIRDADDPRKAARRIVSELAEGLSRRRSTGGRG